MPDSYILFSPGGGTSINLATWTIANEGVDTGARDLRQPEFAQNAIVPGGEFAYERNPVRSWRFPLLLASIGTYGGLDGLAAHLQNQARPGGYLDVIPAGYASANVIRFDVLHGDLQMRQYLPRVQEQAHRRSYDLVLRTDPFGYMPTWMIIASAASVGLPGSLDLTNAASIMGDAPGLAVLVIAPTSPAVTTGVGTWIPDMLAWSLAGKASFQGLLAGGSWQRPLPSGAYDARAEAVVSTVNTIFMSPTQTGWTGIAYYDVASGLEPGYRGRFRAYAYARQDLTLVGAHNSLCLLLDAVPAGNPSAAMASANAIATLIPQPASSWAPQIVDLGVITLPPIASGVQRPMTLRLWASRATHAGTTNLFLDLSAVSLIPQGPAGVLARGLALPDFQRSPSAGALKLDTYRHSADIVPLAGAGSVASGPPVREGHVYYRGDMPLIGASQIRLDLAGAARRSESASAYIAEVLRDTPLAYYRLEESSGATLIDLSGNARHGTYVLGGSYAQPGAFDGNNDRAHYINGASQFAMSASNPLFNFTATWGTVEMWFRRERLGHASFDEVLFAHGTQLAAGTVSALEVVIWAGASAGAASGLRGAVGAFARPLNTTAGLASSAVINDTDWHHLAVRIGLDFNQADIFVDGASVGRALFGASYGATGPLFFGRSVIATRFFSGAIDEVAIYHGSLPNERILAHYQAGLGATALVSRHAPMFAAAQVLYRPRFTFLKNV